MAPTRGMIKSFNLNPREIDFVCIVLALSLIFLHFSLLECHFYVGFNVWHRRSKFFKLKLCLRSTHHFVSFHFWFSFHFPTVSFEFSTESSTLWHELLVVRPVLAGFDLLFWYVCKGSHRKCCRYGIWHQLVWISGWSQEAYNFDNCARTGANLFHGVRRGSCNTWSVWKSMCDWRSYFLNLFVFGSFCSIQFRMCLTHSIPCFFLALSIILLILFNV